MENPPGSLGQRSLGQRSLGQRSLGQRSNARQGSLTRQRTSQELSGKKIELLECTLRDGSYAIDFKFTENDTAVLAGVLGQLGFRWIEVGHGVGLGAAKAGKGTMPASDERLIEAAKRAAPDAQIGSFFIPGIGTTDQLKSAREAGLDFVRIGYNAPEIEDAFSYLTLAKSLGLTVCLNFMKTYGISANAFAEKARAGEEAGADVVYCVDSAGSMFPEDVREYLGEARALCKNELGFHGHSNLQFAVANAVEAVRCGATFIDTTLYGLGRSAGNVPTEIAVAVFNNLGVETGVDLFEVMDAAEEFMGPLMSQMQLYDMMSVATGCSQFHSSFLPKVAAAARKHGVELRRLVVAMGKVDPVNLDDQILNRVAASLQKKSEARSRSVLTSFAAPGISAHSISSSLSAVQSLVDGMMVTCAKRRARPVLELVASESPSPDLVLADLVLAEGPVVLGRVVYGSLEILEQVLKITSNSVPLFLDDKDGGAWAAEWPVRMREIVGAERALPIRSKRLFEGYVEDVLLTAAQRTSNFCLMVYGSPDETLLTQCCRNFKNVVVHGTLPPGSPSNSWQMNDFTDRMHVDLGIGVALLLCPPDASESASIDQLLDPECIVITSGHFPRFENEMADRTILRLDPSQAYRGQMDRWVAISNLMKSAHSIAAAAQ
jgi:4-hydroxy-2-oxovalerate aldolase